MMTLVGKSGGVVGEKERKDAECSNTVVHLE